jgi:hypothetical protein
MRCRVGQIKLYYQDGKYRQCFFADDCYLAFYGKSLRCCVKLLSTGEIRDQWCERVTPSGRIIKSVYDDQKRPLNKTDLLDRFRLIFFRKQIIEEIEKVKNG